MSVIADTDDAVAAASSAAPLQAGVGVRFEEVTVAYKGTVVLDSFSLQVEPGEITALIGPSGSGKTTALRAVAGFVRPVRGRVMIGEDDVTDLPPYDRGLGMVVQHYALFPHMRVDQNVAFGLRAQRAARDLIEDRVRNCLAIVGMESYAKRYPRELSGGQQQRVAIARALAVQPRLLLLDEPLSALDAQIRRNMVDELARLHRDLPSLTILYVTHDQSEALTLADRIAILRDGKLSAFGPSRHLYRQPPNRFTAEFLGRANILPVTVERIDERSGLATVRFQEQAIIARSGPRIAVGDACLLCVRPHALRLASGGVGTNLVAGTVETALWQGEAHSLTLNAGGVAFRLSVPPTGDPPQLGARLFASFSPEDATLIAHDRANV